MGHWLPDESRMQARDVKVAKMYIWAGGLDAPSLRQRISYLVYFSKWGWGGVKGCARYHRRGTVWERKRWTVIRRVVGVQCRAATKTPKRQERW